MHVLMQVALELLEFLICHPVGGATVRRHSVPVARTANEGQSISRRLMLRLHHADGVGNRLERWTQGRFSIAFGGSNERDVRKENPLFFYHMTRKLIGDCCEPFGN